ncbi:uncharacterized protein EDB91DRAFT_1089680 [Suillus paluster]|uniref:uncharacterized protein n=1 Tax=Suillus paluster TaxID=48578 RepID=UPI001B86D6FA|nr:uncharacterized protein EDB91DRAFT_1089680 [Suillus paluster]KAG1718905.1 hypothetical protein EDB91DRAFT_1089680 [Suillus paluster]
MAKLLDHQSPALSSYSCPTAALPTMHSEVPCVLTSNIKSSNSIRAGVLACEDCCFCHRRDKLEHVHEFKTYLMCLDDVDIEEDDQNLLFTQYTIETVQASHLAAQTRVKQYVKLLQLLQREVDGWGRRVEKASLVLPNFKSRIEPLLSVN